MLIKFILNTISLFFALYGLFYMVGFSLSLLFLIMYIGSSAATINSKVDYFNSGFSKEYLRANAYNVLGKINSVFDWHRIDFFIKLICAFFMYFGLILFFNFDYVADIALALLLLKASLLLFFYYKKSLFFNEKIKEINNLNKSYRFRI